MLQGTGVSRAPEMPNDTHPLLDTVAVVYCLPYSSTGNGKLTAAVASSARVSPGSGVPSTDTDDRLQLSSRGLAGAAV